MAMRRTFSKVEPTPKREHQLWTSKPFCQALPTPEIATPSPCMARGTQQVIWSTLALTGCWRYWPFLCCDFQNPRMASLPDAMILSKWGLKSWYRQANTSWGSNMGICDFTTPNPRPESLSSKPVKG
eukprot:5922627-Alexandrium_andersonii.AAC.1